MWRNKWKRCTTKTPANGAKKRSPSGMRLLKRKLYGSLLVSDTTKTIAQSPRSEGIALPAILRGMDLNHRPSGYEPDELPDCSTPHSLGTGLVMGVPAPR